MTSPSRSSRAPLHAQPARIFIVDDQEQNVRLLSRILAKAGYEQVASTTNPADALALQAQFKPDLVVLDVHMEGKDGFQVLEEIVSHNNGAEEESLVKVARSFMRRQNSFT